MLREETGAERSVRQGHRLKRIAIWYICVPCAVLYAIGLLMAPHMARRPETASMREARRLDRLDAAARAQQAKSSPTVPRVLTPAEREELAKPRCGEAAETLVFATHPQCYESGLFSSEGRAVLRACSALIRDGEKRLRAEGLCR